MNPTPPQITQITQIYEKLGIEASTNSKLTWTVEPNSNNLNLIFFYDLSRKDIKSRH